MKDLLFYNIYSIYFYKCDISLYNYFRKKLKGGFILEQITRLDNLLEIYTFKRIFVLIDLDKLGNKELDILQNLFLSDKMGNTICFRESALPVLNALIYNKTERDYFNVIKYIEALSEKEIYYSVYSNLKESIEYAGKIQNSLLPNKKIVDHYFSDTFIYNKPRDIVSGDFYWFAKADDMLFFAVGDCTGHGVPGAFMSILGITLLNEIFYVNGYRDTDIILNILRENIIKSLSQSFSHSNVHDGMDIALCAIQPDYDILYYSGAFNPIVIIRDDEFIELKADKMPVGVFIRSDIKFSKQSFDLKKNDKIYMFTDGYSDQIGGIHSKKLRKSKFYEIIQKINKLNMIEQNKYISNFMNEWKSSNEQMDDMLIVGFKI